MKTEVIPAWGMASVFVFLLVYFRLRLLRFLLWVFALVLVLRFARFFNVNGRQLAVNASQWFLACFARYGRQCFVGMARNGR